uniref:Uncharacterized protein n=1 Tax=Cyanothece sp. (strain PCC 7425 / ATCC 29141) TaxID=395961 RepID=B8HMF9_CYAP4
MSLDDRSNNKQEESSQMDNKEIVLIKSLVNKLQNNI